MMNPHANQVMYVNLPSISYKSHGKSLAEQTARIWPKSLRQQRSVSMIGCKTMGKFASGSRRPYMGI